MIETFGVNVAPECRILRFDERSENNSSISTRSTYSRSRASFTFSPRNLELILLFADLLH